MHLCGERSTALFRFKLWLCDLLSKAFRSDADTHKAFDDGDIVIRLSSSLDDDREDSDEGGGRDEVDRWFHISTMFFNPVKPWTRELVWEDHAVDENANTVLTALHRYFTMWQMLSDVYLADSDWTLRFYELIEEDIPVLTVDAMHVRVRYKDIDTVSHRATIPRSRAPASHAALLDALDALPRPDDPPSDGGDSPDGRSERSEHSDGKTSAEVTPRSHASEPTETPVPPSSPPSPHSSVELFFSDSGDSGVDEGDGSVHSVSSSSSSGDDDEAHPINVTHRYCK